MAAPSASDAPPRHAWSLPERPGMQIREAETSAGAGDAAALRAAGGGAAGTAMAGADGAGMVPLGAMLLTVDEAERYVEGLRAFPVEQAGGSAFLEQHMRVEKLNMQAHQSAAQHSDEFVLEALLTFDKLGLLVDNLMAVDAWKTNVLPKLAPQLGGRNNMRLYFTMYHEASLVNLLEILLFHAHVCEALGEKLVDVVDFCARKVIQLNSRNAFREVEPSFKSASEFSDALQNRSPEEELEAYEKQISFRVCISSVTIIRFLCEHVATLPLSVLTRLLDTHDVLMTIVPLIENPPWTRRLDNGKWQKLIDYKWVETAPADLLTITKTEAQVWLCVYFLVCKQEVRERYHFNTFRKGVLLRIRKYLNDIMLDQIPVLADVQRFMDELAIVDVPDPAKAGGILLMEQIAPAAQEAAAKDWDAIAEVQVRDIFNGLTDRDDSDVRRIATMYVDDADDLEAAVGGSTTEDVSALISEAT